MPTHSLSRSARIQVRLSHYILHEMSFESFVAFTKEMRLYPFSVPQPSFRKESEASPTEAPSGSN